jgi:hypothetical protein
VAGILFFMDGSVVGRFSPACSIDGLFDLAVNKLTTVAAEMCDLGWEDGGAAWQRRRRLWAWEEDLLGECRILLHDISLQHDSTDMWLWRIDPIDDYSVRGVYQMLTNQEPAISDATIDFIWHKQVPLKVSI